MPWCTTVLWWAIKLFLDWKEEEQEEEEKSTEAIALSKREMQRTILCNSLTYTIHFDAPKLENHMHLFLYSRTTTKQWTGEKLFKHAFHLIHTCHRTSCKIHLICETLKTTTCSMHLKFTIKAYLDSFPIYVRNRQNQQFRLKSTFVSQSRSLILSRLFYLILFFLNHYLHIKIRSRLIQLILILFFENCILFI